MNSRMFTRVGSLTLKNPIMPASGTFDYHAQPWGPVDVSRLGALVPKSITLYPQPGNPPSRLAETPSGLINSIGIPSEGLEAFLQKTVHQYAHVPTALVVSIAGYSPEEYAILTRACAQIPQTTAIELNLSCPNLKTHVMPAQDPSLLRDSIQAARTVTDKPLWAKLSPNVTSIADMARIAQEAGANAVVAINTLRAMAINVQKQQAILGHFTGGLSGPAILPIALATVWDIAQTTAIPIIGCGGIQTAEDVLMFLMAGASAVQIGTATFRHPSTMMQVLDELHDYLTEHHITALDQIIGIAKPT
ncbi:MAG: dihydroorotate dehydrogenase [Firmicutes bacterium]|nr:dihydroorotate dehydrogenase [Bacillota bacterium]